MYSHLGLVQVGQLCRALSDVGVRVEVDTEDHHSPGWKYNFWELKVTPPPPSPLPLFRTAPSSTAPSLLPLCIARTLEMKHEGSITLHSFFACFNVF